VTRATLLPSIVARGPVDMQRHIYFGFGDPPVLKLVSRFKSSMLRAEVRSLGDELVTRRWLHQEVANRRGMADGLR
jgi:hypothetical protein